MLAFKIKSAPTVGDKALPVKTVILDLDYKYNRIGANLKDVIRK